MPLRGSTTPAQPLRGAAARALLVALAAPALAHAQGLDAHGPVLPPVDGDPGAPLTLLSPQRSPAGSWSVGGVAEVAEAPLVQYQQLTAGGEPTVVPLLDDVVGVGLGGRYSAHRRLSVGLSVPVFLATSGTVGGGGPALGDLHVWAPVGLVLPEVDGAGFGLSVVPYLDLPTGAANRFLGDQGARAGATAVVGQGWERLALLGNLGFEAGARTSFPNEAFTNQELGGPAVRFGASAGWTPGEKWGLHLEYRLQAMLGGEVADDLVEETQGASAPGELFLTLKGRLRPDVWGAVALGRGVSSGVGAAAGRLLVGGGYSHEPAVVGEVVGDVADGFSLRVVDPAGGAVVGAIVKVAEREVGRTDAQGRLALEDPKWRKGVSVEAAGFRPAVVPGPEDPDAASLDVTLEWVPVPVPVRVTDQEGKRVAAQLVVTSLDDPGAPPIEGAVGSLALVPGAWRVTLAAEGFAGQSRDIVVPADGSAPFEAEVVLLPPASGGTGAGATLTFRVTDPDGLPVAGARVLIDGQPIGTTGEGGALELAALAPGPHRLLVQHEAFTVKEEPDLVLVEGGNALNTVLRRVPGSVRVVAVGPDGKPLQDAVARFDGPRRLAPMPLDHGERITALGPGTWGLVVSSPEFGLQEREIVVPPDSWDLIDAKVVFWPQEQGNAELAIRVVDPEGHPLDGVEVGLDDRAFGATSTGGSMTVGGLLPGPRKLVVSGEDLRPVEPIDVHLVEGLQERVVTMDWVAGTVWVTTRSPDGVVDDALVRFAGPARLPPSPLGPGGERVFHIDPGPWEVVVASESYGLATRDLVIPEDSRVRHVVDVVMNPPEGGLASLDLRVANPDGQAVVGAEVLLDGASLGRTTNTGSLAMSSLSVGRRNVEVRAPLYQAETRDLRLLEGEQDAEIELDWAPGATRVKAVSPEGPVTDAVIRVLGPTAMPPARLDGAGEHLVQLAPGGWQALVVSESWGIAQRPFEITGKEAGLTELTVELAPVASGAVDLLVRVVDEDDRPVAGALITVDGQEISPTGDGGVLLVEGLPPGPARIGLSAPGYAAFAEATVSLAEGAEERVFRLAHEPGTLNVAAKDTAGAPVDAEVTLVGPADAPAFRTGADGVEPVKLRPGTWQVIARTDTLGPARAEVVVAPGGEARAVDLVLEPTKVQVTDAAVVIRETVAFDFAKATLRADSGAVLDQVANAILSRTDVIRVEIQGHTDNVGTAAYNTELSQARAEAVVAALVARGVPQEKLVARGYGMVRPLATNESEEGRAQNRRVEFQIVEQGG